MMYQRMGERVQATGFLQYLPLLLTILHGIIFLFMLIATPVDVFKAKGSAQVQDSHRCASIFGWKPCGSHGVSEGFHCGIKSHMGGAAAFAIISIFATLATFILYILALVEVFKRALVLLIMDLVCFFTILICWACVAGAYNSVKCYGLPFDYVHFSYSYAGSFGLSVTSWVLQIIAIAGVFFVPF